MSASSRSQTDADAQYQVVASRRLQFDNLVWQVPILSLTAQAFLFTIALSGGNSATARELSSVLAFWAAVMSIVLMIRHRAGEYVDAERLATYEHKRGWDVMHGVAWRDRRRSEMRQRLPAKIPGLKWFAKLPAVDVWIGVFAIFAVAAAITFYIAVQTPTTLAAPTGQQIARAHFHR